MANHSRVYKGRAYSRFDGEKMYDAYGGFYHDVHPGDPSVEEAKRILDELMPDDHK